MKYLMIPMRYLTPVDPGTDTEVLAYGATRAEHYNKCAASILKDASNGVIPGWATNYRDLRESVTIVDGPDLPEPK